MPFATVIIDGGLDMQTAPQNVQPGRLRDCMNYEISRQRGVRRIDGYEKFDGGASPSVVSSTFLGLVKTLPGNLVSHFAPGTSVTIRYSGKANGTIINGVVVFSNNTFDGVNTTLRPAFVFPSALSVTATQVTITGCTENIVGGLAFVNGITTVPNATYTNVSGQLSAGNVYFQNTAGLIQSIPGQGNVNGLFWLKDKLYSTRDFITFDFSAATTLPSVGDVLWQGASYGARTWGGTVVAASSTGPSGGPYTGTVSVSNVDGSNDNVANAPGTTYPAAATVNINQLNGSTVTAALTAGASNSTALAAGMYLSSGGRGAPIASRSWQLCDLGWHVNYTNGSLPFVDANQAIPSTRTVLSQNYKVTGWKTPGSVVQPQTGVNSGLWNPGDTSTPTGIIPDAVTQQGDGRYMSAGIGAASSDFTAIYTNFGFTNADIPLTAYISGIEVQMSYGAVTSALTLSSATSPTAVTAVAGNLQTVNSFNIGNYTYAVTAIDSSGREAPIKASAVFVISATSSGGHNPQSSTVHLSWSGAAGVSHYYIYRQFNGGGYVTRTTAIPSATTQAYDFGSTVWQNANGTGTYWQWTPGQPFQSSVQVYDKDIEIIGLANPPSVLPNIGGAMSTGSDAYYLGTGGAANANEWSALIGAPVHSPSVAPANMTLNGCVMQFDFGAGASGTPTTTLGYHTVTPTDITSTNFGIKHVFHMDANAGFTQWGCDYVAVRVSYTTLTDSVYFWNSTPTKQVADGSMVAYPSSVPAPNFTALTTSTLGGTGLAAATAYFYVITALTSDGKESPISNERTVTTGAGATNSNTLTWTAPTLPTGITVTGYRAYRGTSTGAENVYYLPGNVLTYVDTGAAVDGNAVGPSNTTSYGTAKLLNSATANFTTANIGQVVVVTGAAAGAQNLAGMIVAVNSTTQAVLNIIASNSVSSATVQFFSPVRAHVVQHYVTDGFTSTQTEQGHIFFQMVNNATGVVGGIPLRIPMTGDQIRSWPANGIPDGGSQDGSTQIAVAATAAGPNVMDTSNAIAQGALQPDGTYSPSGKFESVTKDFFASSGLDAIIGVSGAGPAFYYTGVHTDQNGNQYPGAFSRIYTGLPDQYEAPRHLCAHQGHVVLGYYAGFVQWSNAANVLSFDPTLYDRTAGNDAVGDYVTSLASVNGDALLIGCRSSVQSLHGNLASPSTVYPQTISPTSGMKEYTLQPMTQFTYCDYRGITTMATTNAYGDFAIGHLSDDISPWLVPRTQLSSFFESGNIGVINSYLCKNKNQYRLSFADGWQVTMTFVKEGEAPQFTFQYFTDSTGNNPFVLNVVQAFTESLGRDRIFCATNDNTGFVYEMDRGNTFNGFAFPAFATLVPDVSQMPFQNKLFSSINVFGSAQDYATFTLSRSAEYSAPTQATGLNVITEQFGSQTVVPTGLTSPYRSIGSSGLLIEGSAVNLRFDSNGFDPSNTYGPQFQHIIQAVSYSIDPLQETAQ